MWADDGRTELSISANRVAWQQLPPALYQRLLIVDVNWIEFGICRRACEAHRVNLGDYSSPASQAHRIRVEVLI
jgi:hypothetical protein